MRLQKVATLTLLCVLAAPAFGSRNVEEPGLYDRLARLIKKVVHVIIPTGNGLIGPIPSPPPPTP